MKKLVQITANGRASCDAVIEYTEFTDNKGNSLNICTLIKMYDNKGRVFTITPESITLLYNELSQIQTN